ncbi:UDP-glycosyltransferase UGT5 [Lucilia cuprina]|uniref:UDP-glycosyltransferase UGT5 n=1 Tax=Lucilia cuprina TaxID=7375 RepID=UPI001F06B184|nr:UDP-glycosyltransferase UGT5 [Lucilia cuprina]
MTKIFTLWTIQVLYLLLATPTWLCQGAHILAVMPSVWKSHYLFGHYILTQLVEQHNHTVTLISPYEMDNLTRGNMTKEKFREIKVEGLLNNWLEMGLSFDLQEMHDKSVMEHFTRLMYATTSNTDNLLQNSQVREMLQSPQKFDLLIVDLFLSDALLGLSFYYQIPTMVLSPSGSNTWLNQRFGNPQNAALDPSNFLPYAKDMTFWQRCVNTLMAMFEKLTYSFFHMISQQAVYTKHFEPLCQLANWCKELPHHKELTENLSLALINTHPVLQYPRAFLPNMLSIAGIHLKTTEEQLELPNHIREFIEKANQGVIYMSFGANIYDFPSEKLQLFFDVFETLPDMRFIIKYDEPDSLPLTLNISKQILLNNWWPQQAILAYKNVKIFITSGGFMSITEALFYEKYILAIPITPEQCVLTEKLSKQNAAYKLNYNDLAYDQLMYAIQQLLQDKSQYQSSVLELKQQLLQNLDHLSPLTRTLNAIEMTLASNGLDYLKPHSHHLNFWNSILIDVMFTLILGLLAILAIPFLLTSCILKRSYQNQTKLNLLNQQQNNHRYYCKVNDFLTSTTPPRNCGNNKKQHKENTEDNMDVLMRPMGSKRRNSDVNSKKRKRLSSNSSSSCCNCSVSSSSAPTTPLAKRESPFFDQVSGDNVKDI